MRKDTLVTVKAKQINEYGEEDSQDFFTTGTLFQKKGAFFIVYNESEVTGMAGTTTSLKVEPNRVTLNRMGSSEQKQVFEEGLKHRGNYITPYGGLSVAVLPSRVEVNLTDTGGSIKLEYELEVENQKISDNALIITVREAGNEKCSGKTER